MLGLVGNEANESAIGVTNLGRSIFRTFCGREKFRGVFQDSRGRLREANGQYAKTNEVIEQLGRTFQRTGRRANDLDRGFTKASSGAGILTRSVSGLGGTLGALSIAAVTHEIGRFGITSVQTAGRLDQLQRALTNIEDSSESAQVRFQQLRARFTHPSGVFSRVGVEVLSGDLAGAGQTAFWQLPLLREMQRFGGGAAKAIQGE